MTVTATTPRPEDRAESCWQQGADAAQAGAKPTDCPYSPLSYDCVTWHNGWAMATHLKAVKDDEL